MVPANKTGRIAVLRDDNMATSTAFLDTRRDFNTGDHLRSWKDGERREERGTS